MEHKAETQIYTQKKAPEPDRTNANGSASDMYIDKVNRQAPQTGDSNITEVKQQSRDTCQAQNISVAQTTQQ